MKKCCLINYVLIMLLFLISIVSCTAQEKEIPITSNSKKAIEKFKEGRDLSENTEYEMARRTLDEALSLDPEFALAYLYRSLYGSNYNDQMNHLENAMKYISKVSESEKDLIIMYKAMYDSNEAVMWEKLDKLLELYPSNKRINSIAGDLNRFWNKDEDALMYYNLVVGMDNKFVPAIEGMGYVFMNMEQYDNAADWFKKLMEIRPDLASPYNSYANALIQQEQFDEAIVYYKKAMEKDEFFYYPIRRIANIYVNQKNYNEARKYFRQYVEVATQFNSKYLAFLNIANTYLYEDDKENALKAFDEYIQLAVQNNMPYYEIWGNIYQGYIITCCGDPKEGLKYYEKVLTMIDESDLNEEQKHEHRINVSMMKSNAYIESEDFQNSEKELENCKILVANLESTFLNDMIDVISSYQDIKQNNYEAALSKLNNVKSKHVLITYYSALAYDLKGDKEQAKNYYSKLINNKESNLNIALRYKEIEEKLAE